MGSDLPSRPCTPSRQTHGPPVRHAPPRNASTATVNPVWRPKRAAPGTLDRDRRLTPRAQPGQDAPGRSHCRLPDQRAPATSSRRCRSVKRPRSYPQRGSPLLGEVQIRDSDEGTCVHVMNSTPACWTATCARARSATYTCSRGDGTAPSAGPEEYIQGDQRDEAEKSGASQDEGHRGPSPLDRRVPAATGAAA